MRSIGQVTRVYCGDGAESHILLNVLFGQSLFVAYSIIYISHIVQHKSTKKKKPFDKSQCPNQKGKKLKVKNKKFIYHIEHELIDICPFFSINKL